MLTTRLAFNSDYICNVDDTPKEVTTKLTASDGSMFDNFGLSVSIDSDKLFITAQQKEIAVDDAGRAVPRHFYFK